MEAVSKQRHQHADRTCEAVQRPWVINLKMREAHPMIRVFRVKHRDESVFPGSAGVNPEEEPQQKGDSQQAD
jgi:hypothetical protein